MKLNVSIGKYWVSLYVLVGVVVCIVERLVCIDMVCIMASIGMYSEVICASIPMYSSWHNHISSFEQRNRIGTILVKFCMKQYELMFSFLIFCFRSMQ